MQKLMKEYPLCCGDHFTMKFLCDVDTDMILERYVKLKGYLASSAHNRTTMRSLVTAGVRLPWVEDMGLEQNLVNGVAILVAKEQHFYGTCATPGEHGLKWYNRKIRPESVWEKREACKTYRPLKAMLAVESGPGALVTEEKIASS